MSQIPARFVLWYSKTWNEYHISKKSRSESKGSYEKLDHFVSFHPTFESAKKSAIEKTKFKKAILESNLNYLKKLKEPK